MASREPDDAMAGLLKRNLAGDGDAANGCPAPDILAAYFERSLDPEEETGIELHFSKCARCREQFAALERAQKAAGDAATSAPPKTARASWLWDWRWLAPVAAVLVITAIWATRRPALTQIAERATQARTALTPAAKAPTQQATPQAKEQDKPQALPRMIAPEPSAAPTTTQTAPTANSSDSNSGLGAPATRDENSETQSLVTPKTIESLPLVSRNYTQLKKIEPSSALVPTISGTLA